MLRVIALLLAGLGLFFVGLHFLTEHLKMLSGRHLRRRIAVWTKHPVLGVFWGGIFLTITQSTAATTFILVGMLRSGMMTVRQALPIIVGANMVGSLVVLILVFDVEIAVLFLLGVTGLLYRSDRFRRFRKATGAAFGIGMLFLGLSTMQSGVAPLADTSWFDGVLRWTAGSHLLGFVIGAVLSFLVQSSVAVTVLTIALARTGLLSLNDAIMIAYGANAGSSLLTIVLSANLSGQSKQIAMFQTAYNIVGALLMVPAFYLEVYGNVPLAKKLSLVLSENVGTQIGIAYLLFNLVPSIPVLILLDPSVRLLKRFWSETPSEQAAKPQYLHEHVSHDTHSALHLVALEQTRLMDILSGTFDAMRGDSVGSQLPGLQETFTTLSGTIRDVMSDLSDQSSMSPETYDELGRLLKLQHALETTYTEVHELGIRLDALGQQPFGNRFAQVVIEGLDVILLTLIEVAKGHSAEDAALLQMMTSENGVTRVRTAYLAEESTLSPVGRMQLLAAANHSERLIWLFGEIGQAYMDLDVQDNARG